MNTRILLASAAALAFAAGTVAIPSIADAAQQSHGGGRGGGHGGGVRMGGAYHGGNVYRGRGYGGGYGGGAYRGGAVYYGGVCGPMQVVLGLCGPYGY